MMQKKNRTYLINRAKKITHITFPSVIYFKYITCVYKTTTDVGAVTILNLSGTDDAHTKKKHKTTTHR